MKRRRRRKVAMSVPTTSMGDIAFLLTIFFILTSNFAKEASIRLKPPETLALKAVKESAVSVIIDDKGQIYMNGREVSGADDVEAALESFFGGAPQAPKNVLFKCDRETDKRVFEPVLEAIAKAGGVVVAVGDRGLESPRMSGSR